MTDQNSTAGLSLSAYTAARESAAWFDRSDEGRLWMAGADLIPWLQGLLTNEVAGRQPGEGFYAACLTPQGRMVSDLRVLLLEHGALADVAAHVTRALLARLEMFVITEDVALRDVSGEMHRLAIVGPESPSFVARLLAAAGVAGASGEGEPSLAARLADLGEHAHLAIGGAGPAGDGRLSTGTCIVAASHEAGSPGFDVYADGVTHDRLVAATRQLGVPALDAPTWEVLRVEEGRPRFGRDLFEDTIPTEAGLDERAVSYTKGCFVGQEILVRMRDIGHGRVARRLVELRPADAPAASSAASDAVIIPPGAELHAGERRVGHVTTSVWSPRENGPLAFGYVHRDSLAPGTRLDALDAGTRFAVIVGHPVGVAR
ncbi:MAG: hypothetical protein KJ061_07220 [Vicinamibacteraceae bacterium]|nr:hypothetical protein [Vicinamibacteraceae bacterium]